MCADAVDKAPFCPCMHHINDQSHHTGSGQDLYMTSMDLTHDYWLHSLQAPFLLRNHAKFLGGSSTGKSESPKTSLNLLV